MGAGRSGEYLIGYGIASTGATVRAVEVKPFTVRLVVEFQPVVRSSVIRGAVFIALRVGQSIPSFRAGRCGEQPNEPISENLAQPAFRARLELPVHPSRASGQRGVIPNFAFGDFQRLGVGLLKLDCCALYAIKAVAEAAKMVVGGGVLHFVYSFVFSLFSLSRQSKRQSASGES